MDTLQSCTNLVTKYCFMASIDLTDAYYSVQIDSKFQKYLKFEHEGTLYQFTCLPNGLSSAPSYFTKLLKPVLTTLRNQGCIYLVLTCIWMTSFLSEKPFRFAEKI